MQRKTIIAMTRVICGTAILITSIITGYNGTIHSIALVLLAVPVEVLQRAEASS